MKYAAILAVLCLTSSVFAVVGYDAPTKTLTYGAASDLDSQVDIVTAGSGGYDLNALATTFGAANTMFGNLDMNGFNALSGLKVLGFNAELTPSQFNLTSTINATYDASHVLTLTDFGDGNGYNYGGGNSAGRQQFSGPHTFDQLGTTGGGYGAPPAGGTGEFHIATPSDIGLNWFAADLSVNQANAGVSALGFLASGRTNAGNQTPSGNIWLTLSDASVVSFPYGTFGGVATDGNTPGIGFFYQAPTGLFVTRVECTRLPNSGSSFVALDDLGFVIGSNGAPHYIQPHDGDANNDGAVDVIDLGVLAKNYDKTGLPTSAVDPYGAGSWQLGDFSGDGNVDVVDLGVLAKNYDWVGAPATSVAIPEPATLSLLGLAVAALIRRRK